MTVDAWVRAGLTPVRVVTCSQCRRSGRVGFRLSVNKVFTRARCADRQGTGRLLVLSIRKSPAGSQSKRLRQVAAATAEQSGGEGGQAALLVGADIGDPSV